MVGFRTRTAADYHALRPTGTRLGKPCLSVKWEFPKFFCRVKSAGWNGV
jgi:hypothetical protein